MERQMAEFLVHGHVPWSAFIGVAARNDEKCRQAEHALSSVGRVWVPIIRSWALTRGFALRPGTRNRYEIRYTRTQHRPPSRQVNDHGRVAGTHTHQRDCGASAASSGPVRALERVHVSGLQVADRQDGRARGASVGCEPDNFAAGVESASVLLVPVPVKHHRGPGLIDGGLQQRLHGVGLVLERWGHLPWQPADEPCGAFGRVVADQHVQRAGRVAQQPLEVLLRCCLLFPAVRRDTGHPPVRRGAAAQRAEAHACPVPGTAAVSPPQRTAQMQRPARGLSRGDVIALAKL